MAGNTFGHIFKVSTFGESHGKAIGGIIDGCPAGLNINTGFIQQELDRRRPGQSPMTSPRSEEDKIEILSGIFEGKSTGTPIGFIIWNKDQHPEDYDHLKDLYRPSHADYTYDQKYGFRDYRGGGRSSARETACRVAAGAIAKLFIREKGITISAFVSQIGNIALEQDYQKYDLTQTEHSPVRCPDPEASWKMEELIKQLKE